MKASPPGLRPLPGVHPGRDAVDGSIGIVGTGRPIEVMPGGSIIARTGQVATLPGYGRETGSSGTRGCQAFSLVLLTLPSNPSKR